MNPRFSLPLATAILALLPALAGAQIPSGYYDTVDISNPTTLRQTLHAVIDDHLRFSYTSSSIDTWNILELAQQDPNDANRVLDVYRNTSYAKVSGGNSNYDREHSWPKSYGFPNDGASNSPYTDCHVLFLCNSSYNSSRSNKIFDTCVSCDEKTTQSNAGMGGGSGVYVGNSNWTQGGGLGKWETWVGRRGDVARALLYMDVRYEGGNHGSTGFSEPDLILTDNTSLISSSATGSNLSVAYMGLLSVLLQWHAQDPPDAFEMNGNEVIYGFQGNRNPFIDHPEWVDCIFTGNCPVPPTPPTAFCFGDGTATSCPCLNFGNNGHGCSNSVSIGGCLMDYTGTSSLAAQDLVLQVSDSIPNSPGLFFSGVNSIASGQGVTFGNGLRCAGGQITRLQVLISGFLGDTATNQPLNVLESLAPGDTRYYQWWYRDNSGQPCGNPFNLSNAIQVDWLP
jgi:endonuclease I